MDRSRKILEVVAAEGAISLSAAISLGGYRFGDHRDQYPLAMLIEADYLDLTVRNVPPVGAENMREESLAITLHLFSIPRDGNGEMRYMNIVSSGSINPNNERVFLKAKGALYIDEFRTKRRDRIYTLVAGFASGALLALLGAWLRSLSN